MHLYKDRTQFALADIVDPYTLFPIKYTIFNSYSTTVAYLTKRGKQFFT